MINAGLSLRRMARELGGNVAGDQVLAPGPGHSPKDRSMGVRLSPTAANGFVVFSYAGDDFQGCRDYVCQRLGLTPERRIAEQNQAPARVRPAEPNGNGDNREKALVLWREGVDPRVLVVELYLFGRALELDNSLAGEVLRWHPRIGAMLALFRNILTGEPQAVSRTFLDREGKKLGRKFLGPVWSAAIMLDAFDEVLEGLHIGEGVETCMAARQLGLRPSWALGSAPAVAAFPTLSGVECLTLLQENDDASERVCEACAARWHAAGREVFINQPIAGKDLNDAIRSSP